MSILLAAHVQQDTKKSGVFQHPASEPERRAEAADFNHEFHQRLALPFGLPLILFAGVILSLLAGAPKRWHAAGVSTAIAGAYYALFIISKMVSVKAGVMPIWLAAWLPNLILLLALLAASVRVLRN